MTRQIPLRAKNGEVRAYATVDDEDYARVAAHRWCLTGKGYVHRHVRLPDGRSSKELLHRFVAGLVPGDGREVDHEDGDPLNNVRSNLRECTHALNGQNRSRGGYRNSTSAYRGVHWAKRPEKWVACATIRSRYHFLGYFDDEQEAARVAAEFRAAHMPFSTEAAA